MPFWGDEGDDPPSVIRRSVRSSWEILLPIILRLRWTSVQRLDEYIGPDTACMSGCGISVWPLFRGNSGLLSSERYRGTVFRAIVMS